MTRQFCGAINLCRKFYIEYTPSLYTMRNHLHVAILTILLAGCSSPAITEDCVDVQPYLDTIGRLNSSLHTAQAKLAELNTFLNNTQEKLTILNSSLMTCRDECPFMVKLDYIDCNDTPSGLSLDNISWFAPGNQPCSSCAACGVCSCTLENFLISGEYRISQTIISCGPVLYRLHYRGNTYNCQISPIEIR